MLRPDSPTLSAHWRTPCPAVEQVQAAAQRAGDSLTLEFVVFGAIERLRIPPARELSRADELWRHTCFEAFVAPVGGESYVEINLSPSQQWAIYAFDRYREGMRPMCDAGPEPVIVGRGPGYLSMHARIEFRNPELAVCDWQVALSAVIEDVEGKVSYWALAHAGEKPDFHDRKGFVLSLPA